MHYQRFYWQHDTNMNEKAHCTILESLFIIQLKYRTKEDL